MDPILTLLLIVLLVVVVVGGVALVARRRGPAELEAPPSRRAPTIEAPPPVVEAPVVEAPVVEAPVAEAPIGEAPAAEAPVEEAPVEEAPVEELVRPSFRQRLGKARSTLSGALGSVLSRSGIDEESWEELEEALIRADVGIGPTQELLDSARGTVREQRLGTSEELVEAVKAEMKARLAGPVELRRAEAAPTIWLFVGVNGVGKTTTIGKVGRRLVDQGDTVVMAAGDTFRAAAAEQLGTWAERCGATLIRGAEGADPSSVIFDAVQAAAARGADVVLADTAGRLHTKTNLMEELAKVRRVADKGAGTVTEVLLVLDATTGQNGLAQARQFAEATDVTGVVLTKLDGSAKGGIVFAIAATLGLPVKLVGLGETAADLVDFDAEEFVEALFARD
jgi:fused signal recognition particle receptor